MATNTKEYVIQLSVDDSGAIKNIDTLDKSLAAGAKSATSVKAELRAIQQELAKFEQGSEEFNKLSLRAGELKDRLNDASEAIRANAGNAIETLSNNVGNLGNRFATLDFDGITQDFKGIAGSIGNIKADDLTKGIKTAASAFASLGKALLFNPLFLIPAAIVGIVAALVALKDKIKPIGALFDAVGSAITAVTDKIEDFLQFLGLAASESEKANQAIIDSSADVIAANDKRYDREIKLAQAAGKEVVKLEIEKRKAQLKTLDDVVQALIVKGIQEGKLSDEDLKKLEEIKEKKLDIETDLQATIIAEQTKANEKKAAENQKDSENYTAAQEKKKVADQKAKDEKIRIEKETQALLKAINEERLNEEELLIEEISNLQKSAQELELQAINDLFFEKIAKAEELGLQTLALEEEQEKQAQAVRDKYAKIETDLQKEQQQIRLDFLGTEQEKETEAIKQKYQVAIDAAKGNAELQKELADKLGTELLDIDKKYKKEELQREQALTQTKLKLASDGIGALSNLLSSFNAKNEQQAKKQFAITKALNIAQALINTYSAVTGALTAGGNPLKLATGQQFVEAGIAATVGLAQVAKIASTKYGGGSSGGGNSSVTSGGGGGGTAPVGGGGGGAPTFNPVNTAFLNNRPPQATPAYVLSGAVTDAQVADQKIKEQARL